MAKSDGGYDIAVPLLIIVCLFFYCIAYAFPQYSFFWDENFVASRTALKEYRYQTLVLSVFYHKSFTYLILTTLGLIGFGMALENVIGSKRFMELFMITTVVSAFNHCMFTQALHRPDLGLHGASGPLTAILVLLVCIYRRRQMRIFGFLPVEPSWFVVALVGMDLAAIFSKVAAKDPLPIGLGSNLTALFVGVLYYHYVYRRRVWRRLQVISEGMEPQPVRVTNMGWILPCKDPEEHDDMVRFFNKMFGMSIVDQGEPTVDTKVQRFTKMRTPVGSLNLVDPSFMNNDDMYVAPVLSITVDNLANAVKNMDSRNVKMVAPVWHAYGNWAIVYYRGPDGRVYEIKGPSPTEV